jgi:four helix bundle protein
MQDFKKLQVWQKAHALTLGVDRASKRIRGSQYASLRNQIFRAASSIPANIAEGRRQKSQKDFGRFLSIALNSSSELEYHLILARDTENLPEKEFLSLVGQTITVRKMLYALLKRVAESESTSLAVGNESDQSPKPSAKESKAESQNSKPPAAPPKAAGR